MSCNTVVLAGGVGDRRERRDDTSLGANDYDVLGVVGSAVPGATNHDVLGETDPTQV
jgi:hypothetical protein